MKACIILSVIPFALLIAGIASAGVIFEDDFDDGDAYGWKEYDGLFAVDSGVYVITSQSFYDDARSVNGIASMTDYTIDVDFKFPEGHACILFHIEEIESGCDAGKYYQLHIYEDHVGFCLMNYSGGACTGLANIDYTVTTDVWHHAKLVIDGITAVAYVDGDSLLSYDGFTHYPAGRFALKRINDGVAYYDNVVVSSGAPGICGDTDFSGYVDIDDVVYLIDYLFTGGPPPMPLASGDVDCSGYIDIDDVVYLIDYLFTSGYPPCDINGDDIPDC